MQQPAKLNYKVYQGSTFQEIYRWESSTKVYTPITSITKTAPCQIITSSATNIPVGWRFRVTGAGGMKEINTVDTNYYIPTEVSGTTITINSINSTQFAAYTSGGILEYNQPVNLIGYQARMQIRETVESSTIIYEATTQGGQILLDNIQKTITLTIPASATQQFTFETAVYSVELFNGPGQVVPFLAGNLVLIPEVTR